MTLQVAVTSRDRKGRIQNVESYKERDYFQVTQMAIEQEFEQWSIRLMLPLLWSKKARRQFCNGVEQRLKTFHMHRLKRNKDR